MFEITRKICLSSEIRAIFETEYFCMIGRSNQIQYIGTIEMPIGTNNWDVKTNLQELVRKRINMQTNIYCVISD